MPPLPGLRRVVVRRPTAHAVGYFISPLRGFLSGGDARNWRGRCGWTFVRCSSSSCRRRSRGAAAYGSPWRKPWVREVKELSPGRGGITGARGRRDVAPSGALVWKFP